MKEEGQGEERRRGEGGRTGGRRGGGVKEEGQGEGEEAG